MIVNRKELARRIAYKDGYNIGDIEEVLKTFEDIMVEALENGEEIKLGSVFRVLLQELPEKRAWDGLNKRHFIREAKKVPKFKALPRISEIELPVDEDERE